MGKFSGSSDFASTEAGASYPRVYRYAAGTRAAITLGSALMAAGAIWLARLGVGEPTQPASTALFWCAAGLALLAALTAVSCVVSRMTLNAGSIEVRGVFGGRELRRDAIRGRRLLPTRGQPVRLLVPRNGRPLRLSAGYPRDAVLNAWFDSLPDLDRQDRAASKAQIVADPSYGATSAERLASLARAGLITKVAHVAVLGICAWGFIFPHPYRLVVAVVALLPWATVALVASSKGLIRFDTSRNDVRPSVVSLLIFPGMVLAVRALSDIHLLDATLAVEMGVLAGLPLLGVLWLVHQQAGGESRGWGWPMLMLVTVALPYGSGALSLADVLLDHATPQVFSAQVTDKFISSGKHPRPTLVLAPWGPVTDGGRVSVTRDFYAQTAVYTTVCPELHPGEVGLPWFRVRVCEPAVAVAPRATPSP